MQTHLVVLSSFNDEATYQVETVTDNKAVKMFDSNR